MTSVTAAHRSVGLRSLVVAVAALAVVAATMLAPPLARAEGADSISYYYNASNRTFYATPAGYGGGGDNGPPYEYGYVPDCQTNGDPTSGLDALCTAFQTICTGRGVGNGRAFVTWRPWPVNRGTARASCV